jgi:hypoxanthine phosphoribosyltransferase
MCSSRERSKSTYTKHYSWFYVDRLIEKLLKRMSGESPYFKHIVAISRGGLVPGTILSHRLKLPMYVLDPRLKYGIELKGEVLVVDDVVDTGQAMSEVANRVIVADHARIWYAVLVRKYWAPTVNFWAQQDDAWIEFPWEKANTYGI